MIEEIALPQRFTFPFYYEPHPLALIAAADLQHYLETQTDIEHNFGLPSYTQGFVIGKMFGVLVVADKDGKIGYLWGCSGKLAGANDHPRFVPPVFDMLTENSFFLKEQEIIDAVNREIDQLQADERYHRLKRELEQLSTMSADEVTDFKKQVKVNKEHRRMRREEGRGGMDADSYALLEAELARQSNHDQWVLKMLTEDWKYCLQEVKAQVAAFEDRIEALKNERRERSGILQEQLFEQYTFLNIAGERKSLQAIFSATAFGRPPAGAGECATPKLLQYAFAHGYRPLAMAEFWWGAPPKSEIRKHKQFYPACAGKCKPILGHMLEGMPVDDSPFLQPSEDALTIGIVYEDDHLLVVNKPAGLRSVPGIDIADSVYSRLKTTLSGTEPLMIHRLDMGTSGLLVVAKTPRVHTHIQKQFLERTVSKRYTALLSKAIEQTEGEISLPLIPDPFNRPRQLVCFETGKKSITRWKVVEQTGDITKVHFWPLTGRTHQLRMHAAHELGLNAPIVGDDLYGTPGKRLYLHAGYVSFTHPVTKEKMSFDVGEDF